MYKKLRGCQLLLPGCLCCKHVPMCVGEASTTKLNLAPTTGCVAERRDCLVAVKAVSMDSDYDSLSGPFLLLLRLLLRGPSLRALPGKNLL